MFVAGADHDVSLFAVEQLRSSLTDLHFVDRDVRRDVARLRRTLIAQRDAGTPWRAREAAEILADVGHDRFDRHCRWLEECPCSRRP